MHRSVSIANLVQAGIYGAGAYWLKERWGLSAGIAGACCLLQIAGAVSVLIGRARYAPLSLILIFYILVIIKLRSVGPRSVPRSLRFL